MQGAVLLSKLALAVSTMILPAPVIASRALTQRLVRIWPTWEGSILTARSLARLPRQSTSSPMRRLEHRQDAGDSLVQVDAAGAG